MPPCAKEFLVTLPLAQSEPLSWAQVTCILGTLHAPHDVRLFAKALYIEAGQKLRKRSFIGSSWWLCRSRRRRRNRAKEADDDQSATG